MVIVRRIISKAFRIVSGCEIIYKTDWYKSLFLDPDHDIYPDNYWYRKNDERNFDVVNLGSSGGKWAFCYEDLPVKGMNWAQAPQTLIEDYNLLRHFHSILRDGGYVLITIMPFTGINKKTGIYDALKYLNFDLQGEPIEPYMFDEAARMAKYPVLLGKRPIKELVKYLIGRRAVRQNVESYECDLNPMDETQLNADAKVWIEGWKRQFSIDDLDAPLTLENKAGREIRINVMRELIDFCTERGYKPVYVIPPVTPNLSRYYTPMFEDVYIRSFLYEVKRDVPVMDYSKDNEFQDKDLYFNSFFLNRKGRNKFTRRVLCDLGILSSEA